MDGHDVPFGSQARPQKKTKKQKDKKQRQKNKENQASHQSGKKGLSSRLEKNDPTSKKKKIRQGHRDDAAACCQSLTRRRPHVQSVPEPIHLEQFGPQDAQRQEKTVDFFNTTVKKRRRPFPTTHVLACKT